MATLVDGVRVVFDEEGDTLYTRFPGSTIIDNREAPHDYEILLGMNPEGETVGVTFMGVGAMSRDSWLAHPDRTLVPLRLLSVIDKYVGQRKPPTAEDFCRGSMDSSRPREC